MKVEAFTTERLAIGDWRPSLAASEQRAKLARALIAILTPPVLAHLPPSLHLAEGQTAVTSWIDARAAESDVLLVKETVTSELIGLVILAPDPDVSKTATVHIGYLLGEAAWGQGHATELVSGLVTALKSAAPLRLLGGVDKANPASARVLQKAGFTLDAEQSTDAAETYVRIVS